MMLSEQHNDLGHDMTYFAMETETETEGGSGKLILVAACCGCGLCFILLGARGARQSPN